MDDQNTDSDSHSVTSTLSASSASSKQKYGTMHAKDASTSSSKPLPTSTKRKPEDEGKVNSTPKRKKGESADSAGTGTVTPNSSSARKAAPLSERQQMAIALAMSAQESGGSSPVHNPSPSANAPDTTPRSAMLRKVNRRNEKGESPLHLATIRGDVDGMKKLLKAGAGVNVPDYAGWTALHEACNHGFVNAAKLLLRKGANVNAQGLDNDTPLHDAAINGHPELVSLLLKYGANANQANSKGQSPLDVALNDDITKLLKGETVFRIDSDESDQSASSPEGMLSKEEEASTPTPLPNFAQSACKPRETESSLDNPQLPSEDAKSAEVSSRKSASSAALQDTTALQSRPSSTGFSQGREGFASDHAVNKTIENKSSTGAAFNSSSVKDWDASRAAVIARDECKDGYSSDSTITKQSANTSSVGATMMETQLKLSPESSGKSARQSLNFKPMSVSLPASADSTTQAEPSPASVTKEGISSTPDEQNNVSTEKSSSSPSANTTFASKPPTTSTTFASKPPTTNTTYASKPATDALKATGDSSEFMSLVPTSVDDVTTPEPSTEEATQNIPSVVEFAAKKEVDDSSQLLKSLTSAVDKKSPVEQVKQVEKKSASRPVSPAPDKTARGRTGSVHRKRRQPAATSSTNQTAEQPAQADGDNSSDSISSNASTTRASRSRNKQNNPTNTQTDDEPPPVRETRRKAMLKERAAANSPSADKLVKSGSQKVPPLTIKLPGNKSPSAPTSKDSSNSSAAAGGELLSNLQDKEAERNNNPPTKERSKDSGSPDAEESLDKGDTTIAQASLAQTVTSTASGNVVTTSVSTGVTTRRTLRSHTNRNQNNVGDKLEDHAPPRKSKRMMKAEPPAPAPQAPSFPPPPGPLTIFNPYNLFKDVREQLCKKWERIATVAPRAPAGYPSYMINTKKYLLMKNAGTNASKLAIPLTTAPSQLSQPMKNLFNKQELERYKLRQQHLIEGEKLRIAYEQEIVRVHNRGARAAVNQETPLSLCTVLKDKESATVYHPFNALKEGSSGQGPGEDKSQIEKASARSHFNNRQLISWLQDTEDKFDKLKDQMLSRHHHEAESLYAVQTMDWEWELKELGLCDYKAKPAIDVLHVPMVVVNDDADILNTN